MTDVYEQVKQDPVFRQEATRELTDFRKETIAGRAQVGEILLIQNKALIQAGQVMADEIYDLTEENDNLSVENSGLRNQLGTCLNEDQLKTYCQEGKMKLGTDTNRNNRIRERLNKRLEESRKQIKYSSNAANAFVPRLSLQVSPGPSATVHEIVPDNIQLDAAKKK